MKSNCSKCFSYKDVQLIVYDFDGVMTDNTVILREDGLESVIVNRSDGLGVSLFRKQSIPQLILSTETNPVVQARAKKLNLEVIGSSINKKADLCEYCRKRGYDIKKTLYVGNDLNDLEVMKIVGLPVAPADAHAKILEIALIITKARGGHGVIAELASIIINQY